MGNRETIRCCATKIAVITHPIANGSMSVEKMSSPRATAGSPSSALHAKPLL
jgi:hypothetical protein